MSEVGNATVAIFPTFRGFGSAVSSEASSAGRAGGRTFNSAFNAGAGDPGAALVKKLNAQIASGSSALSKARLAEQDAAGKVRVAEAALAEARARGGEGSARAVAAEERLATAQRRMAEASGRTRSATDQLSASQARLAEATADAGASGDRASGRFASGWASLKQRLSRTTKDAVDGAGDAAESSADRAGKSSGGAFGTAFKGALGALAGIFAVDQLVGGLKSAVSGAANLEQSVGAIGTVFKGSAAEMNAWADQAAVDVGLSKNEFNELGTLIGSQLKNGGTAMEDLAPKTKDLITLGADLSSMFGGTTADAVGALSSALKGERDPIEKYGVSLNQAKIDAEAAALGFSKVGGSLSAEANQAATLSLIMKQTADAHGNFGRETDTLAHKQQVLNAQLANGKARIGTELLPVVAALTGALSSALGPAINGTVAGIRKIVGAGQGLYDLFAKGDFTGALADAFNVEEDSGFVDFLFRARDAAMEVRGGILAFGAAWKANNGDVTSDGFAGVMERIANGLREGVGGVRAFFAAFAAGGDDVTSSGFAGFLETLGLGARRLFDTLAPAISGLLPQVVSLWSAFSPLQIIFAAIQPLLPQLVGMFGQLASTIGGTLSSVLTGIIPMIMQLSALISQSLGQVLAAVLPAAVQMITMLGATFSSLLPVIMPIIATIVQLATTLISQLMPIITDLVSSVMPPVVSIFGNVLSAIGPVIQIIAGQLITTIRALMPVVVTVFGVVANVVKSAMQVVQGIIQVVTAIITGNWRQAWDGIVNIISGAVGLVGNVIGGLGAIVFSALGGIGTWLVDSGKALIQGFIDGIKGMVGAIGDAVGGVLDFAKSFFPHSPAKRGPFSGKGYTSFSGEALAKDFAGGIDSQHALVARSASRLMSSASLEMHAGPVAASGTAGGSNGPAKTVINNFNELSSPRATALQVARIQEGL